MAAAAPSPLTSSIEKINGAKLSRLLIDGGTTVLRNVFDRHHPPANLAADLNTNYSILSNLLRRRVLNGHQWDKLFPPGGTAPDTNTFDITLLFLLLTNICGLTPPLSGWHAKPLPSDTSLEANLARIKFFRNGLYGHVASTGVDTPTFSSLWQEISTVLVSLGLDQAEIVRLKAEHDGEEDYIDALLEWADGEEDIKSQLKDIRQSQTQTEEKLKDVHQSQLKLHETLQEVTSKLEKVSQTQSRTQDILESKLEEVNQKVNITHQAFEEAHRESISWLQGVDESQTKTHQVVSEVRDSIQEVKQEMESLRKEKEREDEVLKSLVKSEFRGDIEYHAQKFQKGTREWIFKSVQKWLDDRTSLNRVMIISGNAGMGKTVIAAVVAQRMQEAGRLSGSHFCQHNNARYRNPRLMLQSLACHLTHALPDYKHALVEQLSRNLGKDLNNMDVQELFALLFREPLSTVDDPGRNILIVIDGLDESEYRGRNELLDVIGNHFSKLPVWIRILITTRPERSITEALQHLKPTQLEQNEEENLNDIQILFQSQLSHKIGEEHKDILLKKLVNKSEGLFIYAYFLIDFIQKNVLFLTPDQLENILPLGISSVYLSYFKRLEQELCIELKADEEHVLRFLCALTASREPLPIEFASRILNPSERSLIAQRRVNKAIACISALLPVHDGRLDFFHKSVKDWLTESACYGQHDFTVEEKEGHKVLSNLCASELDSIKRNGVHGRQFNNTEKYALQHGVQHMLEAEQWDDRSGTSDVKAERIYQYVTDIELIYAKLCVKSTSASEDLLSLQNSTLLDKQSHFIVMSLLRLLRKHSYILRDLPHLFFQSLVNEGVPELSSRAASILESQVPKIPYMNYVGSGEEKGALQARFYCSDTIACFDISPKLDYMVCECRDATIHLWSLQTGNREWVRPSPTMREYYSDHPTGSAFRRIQHRLFLSFYHSVTFHPSGKSVLPGTLQYAYTISGEREDLFPVSDCTFSNCAFSKDKKVILTDCPTEPKRITLWNVENGKERSRIDWKEDISSFAISEDGSLIALSDVTGKIVLVDPVDNSYRNLLHSDVVCGLMHFTYDNNTLVCGFLCLSLEEEYGSYVCDFTEKPMFLFLTPLNNVRAPGRHLIPVTFQSLALWPFVASDIMTECEFMKQTLSSDWVNSVHRVMPYLSAGSYIRLSDETALVGSPSFNYVAMLNVDLLNIPSNSGRYVSKVVFSTEGDIFYSISSDRFVASSSKTIVTVFKASSREILGTKIFFGPVSIAPTKEGAVLFTNERVAELWNFELSKCIRPLTKLTYTAELLSISDELIAFFNKFGSNESINIKGAQESEESQESSDDLVKLSSKAALLSIPDERLGMCYTLGLHEFQESEKSEESSDDSEEWSDFCTFGNFLNVETMSVSPLKIVMSDNDDDDDYDDEYEVVLCISCNSPSQVLVCTSKDNFSSNQLLDEEKVTISLRSKRSVTWKRNTVYILFLKSNGCKDPHMFFSPKNEFVVTWKILDAGEGLHVLDAKTGETLHVFLRDRKDIVDCKFVDDEFLVCCSKDNFLRLYDVSVGVLLSVLNIGEQPFSLGAYLYKPLVAIGLSDTKLKLVMVQLPTDTKNKKVSTAPNRSEINNPGGNITR